MSANVATKTRARGWERKRAKHDTYEEILEAAAQAFSKNGYDGTSLAEIAKAVGIKTPALYYHFKSKNEILYAYLVRSGEQIFSAVQLAVVGAGEDPKKRLCAFVKTYIRTQLEMIDTMPTVNTVIFSSTVSKALTRSQYKWILQGADPVPIQVDTGLGTQNDWAGSGRTRRREKGREIPV